MNTDESNLINKGDNMSKVSIVTVSGVFSELNITLNNDIVNKLALIPTDENPLAQVEKKLKSALKQFEKDYSKVVSKL